MTVAALAVVAVAGCSAGPSQSELAGYEKRLAPALGDILPADKPVGGRIALVDAVSAPGSFLDIDQKTLAAGLRQRRIFEEVRALGPDGTPAAAREAGFAFFLRFEQGRYRHHSVHHPENRLARYTLTDLATGTARTIDLNLDEHERFLTVDPGWARYDSGRKYGVDPGMRLRALVDAVEREARSFAASRKPAIVVDEIGR
ncbi:MAG TPA: hypothetical protein PK280_09395 [Planctomycetota bacterium]|nr:hypothetical protein [Planctomycetota bacterium]